MTTGLPCQVVQSAGLSIKGWPLLPISSDTDFRIMEEYSVKRRILLGCSALIMLLLVGVAFAAWLGDAEGSGRARATTAVSATINPVNCTSTPSCIDLYPGYTGGDLYFTIANDNPYPITFTDMEAGTITVDAGHAPDCPASSITVDSPVTGLTLVAPADSTSSQLSVANAVTMSSAAPDGCQGASFDVELTLAGAQS